MMTSLLEFQYMKTSTNDVGKRTKLPIYSGLEGWIYTDQIFIVKRLDKKFAVVANEREYVFDTFEKTEQEIYSYANGRGII